MPKINRLKALRECIPFNCTEAIELSTLQQTIALNYLYMCALRHQSSSEQRLFDNKGNNLTQTSCIPISNSLHANWHVARILQNFTLFLLEFRSKVRANTNMSCLRRLEASLKQNGQDSLV